MGHYGVTTVPGIAFGVARQGKNAGAGMWCWIECDRRGAEAGQQLSG